MKPNLCQDISALNDIFRPLIIDMATTLMLYSAGAASAAEYFRGGHSSGSQALRLLKAQNKGEKQGPDSVTALGNTSLLKVQVHLHLHLHLHLYMHLHLNLYVNLHLHLYLHKHLPLHTILHLHLHLP